MAVGRFKNLHLVLILGISLFIPFILSYSLNADLSGTVFVSSDMSFDSSGDEDLSTFQGKFKVFVATVSCNLCPRWNQLFKEPGFLSSSLTSCSQISPVLRC
jgi:hypothetical protein